MIFYKEKEIKVKHNEYVAKYYIDIVQPTPYLRFKNFVVFKDRKKICHKILNEPMNNIQLKQALKQFIKRWEEKCKRFTR